jgi:hypothetical protein
MTFPLAVAMEASLWPVLQVPIPMTEEAWEQMLSAIQVLKVGVVRRLPARMTSLLLSRHPPMRSRTRARS